MEFFFVIEINPNRLTIEELKKKLSDYGIDTDIISDNRVVLAEILQNISNDETSKQVSGKLFLTINCHITISKLISFFSK